MIKANKNLFVKKYDVEYSFRIRRQAEGSFKNLWSLEAKTPEAVEWETIIDADSLSTVVDRMQYMFEMDGF